MKKMDKKGFTLAELLIVVAIIAVLVAISIPVFSAQLEKSREATDIANVRSAYASLVGDFLTSEDAAAEKSIEVPVSQKEDKWQSAGDADKYTLEQMLDGAIEKIEVPAATSGNYVVKIGTDGKVTVTAGS